MNDQASGRDTEKAPKDYPPMTVLPVEGEPGCFYVLGERGWWYWLKLEDESEPACCECEDHLFRGRDCKHIKQARAFRAAGGVEQGKAEVDEWSRMTEDERKAVFA